MASATRDQSLPARVLTATSYEILPGADNINRPGTARFDRWPTIVKFDRHPDGIALAHSEAGVTKRDFDMLERHGQLRLPGPGGPQATPAIAATGPEKPRVAVIPEDEESRHPEGAASYRLHRQLERDTSLAEQAKLKRLADTGSLSCES